jgi:hypothetical protein
MNGLQGLDRFQFDEEGFVNQQINAVGVGQRGSPKGDRKVEFTFYGHAAQGEFQNHAIAIRGFEQPRAELAMHDQGSVHRLGGELLDLGWNDYAGHERKTKFETRRREGAKVGKRRLSGSTFATSRLCAYSDVEELHVQGVVLDELAAGGDLVAHEEGEQDVGFGGVGDVDLQEAAFVRVHGGLEELLRVHFAETLVALDAEALAAVGADVGDDLERAVEFGLELGFEAGVLGDEEAGLGGRGGEAVGR